MRGPLLLALLALWGCGDGRATGAMGTGGGGAAGGGGGTGGEGGGFAVPDYGPTWDGCQPGEAAIGGRCLPAGIPPEICGDHFLPDGDGSCVPLLPSEPCPLGALAVPGEEACAPVAPCGAGTWDGIPVETDTEYVDGSYGGVSDGTMAQPWSTVTEAVQAAAPDAIVAIAPGVYQESVYVDGKALRFWGKCPAEVSIDGGADAAIWFQGQDGEVHGLGVTGFRGVRVTGQASLLVERCWIHDTTVGVEATAGANGSPDTTLRRTLIEVTHNRGVYGFGGALTIEESSIRDINPTAISNGSQAIDFGDALNADELATLTLRRTLIERGRRRAIETAGAAITIEDLVVRDIVATDDLLEAALYLLGSVAADRVGTLDAERVYLEDVGGGGIRLYDMAATIEGLVVRDTAPTLDNVEGGEAIEVSTVGLTSNLTLSSATLRYATIDRVHSRGVLVLGGLVDLEAVRIRDVAPWSGNGTVGHGVYVQWQDEVFAPAAGSLNGVEIQRAHEAGIAAAGAVLQIDGALVTETLPRADGSFGRGIALQHDPIAPFATQGTVRRTWVDGASEAGIGSHGADLVIDDTRVDGVSAGNLAAGACYNLQERVGTQGSALISRSAAGDCQGFGMLWFNVPGSAETTAIGGVTALDEQYGDGVTVVLAPVALSQMVIADAARVGAATFGAPLSLADVVLDCSPIDLNGESFTGAVHALDNLGGNRCGCGAEERGCKVQSAGLEPPPALTP